MQRGRAGEGAVTDLLPVTDSAAQHTAQDVVAAVIAGLRAVRDRE